MFWNRANMTCVFALCWNKVKRETDQSASRHFVVWSLSFLLFSISFYTLSHSLFHRCTLVG